MAFSFLLLKSNLHQQNLQFVLLRLTYYPAHLEQWTDYRSKVSLIKNFLHQINVYFLEPDLSNLLVYTFILNKTRYLPSKQLANYANQSGVLKIFISQLDLAHYLHLTSLQLLLARIFQFLLFSIAKIWCPLVLMPQKPIQTLINSLKELFIKYWLLYLYVYAVLFAWKY